MFILSARSLCVSVLTRISVLTRGKNSPLASVHIFRQFADCRELRQPENWFGPVPGLLVNTSLVLLVLNIIAVINDIN